MLYFIVRVGVNMLALWLTLNLFPGIRMSPLVTEYGPGTDPQLIAIAEIAVPFIVYFVLALLFWFWNWLFWPIILFFTGKVVVWSFGLLLILLNALVFYWVVLTGEDPAVIVGDPPWFWIAVGGLSMTFWLFVLEGITGLDSPLRIKASNRRRYWRILGKLSIGGRNYFAENLRIAQSLDIITIYLKDIAFDASPFGPVRRFFQRIMYWRKKPLISESAPETVRYMLQELGPTFVKLGQVISSRAEQLPPDWRVELAKLQSNVEPFSYEEACRIITAELGKSPDELYINFEHAPLAAASTAQVHRAVLPDGQDVVVKVQRPDIDITVKADLNVMRDFTKILEQRFTWARNADLFGIMTEYADNILLELDYANEAFNGRLLAQNMAMFPDVHVPTIYTKLSSSKVMTQEFINGVKITKVNVLDEAGVDRTSIAITFMHAIVKQVLYDGFFHGDPHPGNVFVDPNTSKIIFLDMGMMGTLSGDQRLAIADLLWSLSSGDKREIAKTVLRLTTSFKEVDEDKFIENVDRLLTRYTALTDANMSISGAMKALFDAMYTAGLRMDPELTLALKAMIQAEETVRTLDPSLPLVDTAFTATKQLLVETFDADKVIASLKTQMLRGAKEAIRSIPSIEDAMLSWIQQFRSGRFTVYVDTTEVSKQIREIDNTLTSNVRRLILALLLVGLLIGASIASTTTGNLLPDLPELAYFIFMAAAVVAGAVIVRAIWRWLTTGEI